MSRSSRQERWRRAVRLVSSVPAFVCSVACSTVPRRSPDASRDGAQEQPPPAEPSATAPTASAPSSAPAAEPEPLEPEALELEVPGFGAALVVLPKRSARPAPILVAAHGAGDSPEWQCEHWGGVARGRYFVLCPRGRSLGRGSGYYFANHFELERELVAALARVREEHGALVRSGGGVYTGYSQGATMGALMIVEHGAEFPYLVLVEGGTSEWSAARAKRYAATGGRSVALVCGGSGCMRRAENAAKILERAGLRVRTEHVPGGGHTYVGAVGDRATEVFESWLFAEP